MEPVGRGEGFAFVDSIVGGAIPRQYIPAVQKGIEDTMATGGVHGFPVVDVKVQCYDGKYHNVDSSEMAFRTAASVGFKDALVEGRRRGARAGLAAHRAGAVLVPGRRDGRHQLPPRPGAGHQHRRRRLGGRRRSFPTAEILRYAIDLRSMTGGRGSFTATHDHYDVLPSHLDRPAKATLVAAHS